MKDSAEWRLTDQKYFHQTRCPMPVQVAEEAIRITTTRSITPAALRVDRWTKADLAVCSLPAAIYPIVAVVRTYLPLLETALGPPWHILTMTRTQDMTAA